MILNEEQRQTYARYLEGAETNQIEVIAMRDLATLQSTLPLSEEQKDQAFATFVEVNQSHIETALNDPEGSDNNDLRDRRIESLGSILSANEMAIYERGSWLNVAGGIAETVPFEVEPPADSDYYE